MADTEQKCPHCKRAIEDHWSLAMTKEELDTWYATPAAGVCYRSRGEILLQLEGIS